MKSLLFLALFLSSQISFSKDVFQDPALLIASVETYQVETPTEVDSLSLPTLTPSPTTGLAEIALAIDSLIAIGKKIWPIIDKNRPVITTTGLAPMLSVLPNFGNTATAKAEFYEMTNWSAPRSVSYRVVYKNGYGMEVVGFTYTVYFQYNGSYRGTGNYITSLKVQASEIYAAWGFNFNATSELVNIANAGNLESPVASAIIQISYNVRGLLNESRSSQSFYVDGLGAIKNLK